MSVLYNGPAETNDISRSLLFVEYAALTRLIRVCRDEISGHAVREHKIASQGGSRVPPQVITAHELVKITRHKHY
jgi:hypothetical protein